MDYKKQSFELKLRHKYNRMGVVQLSKDLCNDCLEAAKSIDDLLARAEAAEAAQETLQRAMAEYKARAEKAEMERDKCKAKYCAKEPCTTCIHYEEKDCEGDCLSCTADCPCNKCYDYSMWEWNGKKEE